MLLVIACLLLAIGLIWALVRATKPKMPVLVETRVYEEETASGQRVQVSSVSSSYDPLDHRVKVEEWKHDLKAIGLAVALVVVVVTGIVAYSRIH